jgi:hypothetical protein
MTELPTSLDEIKAFQEKLKVQEALVIEKSFKSNDPDLIIKAAAHYKDIEKRDTEKPIKSYIFDPYNFNKQFGYKDKPTSLSYDLLRRMGRTPIINAIITTRVEQVSNFSDPCYDDTGVGFKIRKKQGYLKIDKNEKLSKKDEARIEFLTDFLLNCGNSENAWHGDSFDTFLRKFTRDSLELDQATFEVIRNRKGIPQEFIATDGATFRLADTFDDDEYKSNERLEVNGYFPSYVQIFQNQPRAEFYPWELCFSVRNHYTDVRLNGYGVSELETITNVVTWMLYSDTYNGKFFAQGSAPKGILKVSGGINEARLAEFRQQWQAMVAGVQNAWRTPVIESDKMEWIDLQRNNRDMEFAKWQEYLIKLGCAAYKIDPAEIGFPMQGSSDSKPMFEGNNEARLKFSRDKGLKPLLKMIQFKINKYLINPLDPDYEFVFVGLDAEDEVAILDADIKKAGSFMTIKEIRKKYNLPDKIADDDIIANPYWMQTWQMKNQQQQPGMGGGDPFGQSQEGGGSDEEAQQQYDENGDTPEYLDFKKYKGGDEEDPITKAFNEWLEKENEINK